MRLQHIRSHGDARVAFRVADGAGRPIVFIPGWVCPQVWWDATLEQMPPGFRAITLDYPGTGHSTPAGRRQWALENFARDVRSVIEFLDLRDVVVVGHSMGGAVALEVAYLCSDRVSMVVGCDAFTYPEYYPRYDERDVDAALAPYRLDFATAMKTGIGSYFLPQGDETLKVLVSEVMASAEPEIALATMEHFLRWDLDASLKRCPVPVASINAKHFLKRSVVEQYGDRIDIRTIDGVGHFLMLEKPQEFAATLVELIETKPSVSGPPD